jgi:hypothetical protein
MGSLLPGYWGTESRGWLLVPHYRPLRRCLILSLARRHGRGERPRRPLRPGGRWMAPVLKGVLTSARISTPPCGPPRNSPGLNGWPPATNSAPKQTPSPQALASTEHAHPPASARGRHSSDPPAGQRHRFEGALRALIINPAETAHQPEPLAPGPHP